MSKESMTQETILQSATSKESALVSKQESLDFQPLIQIEPSLLDSSRVFASLPSTEQYYNRAGIAKSNKNFERKMRYLLGEEEMSKAVMKSASTAILDTKLKRFYSNISGCQHLPSQAPELNLHEIHLPNDKKVINLIKPHCNIVNTESGDSGDDHKQKQLKFNQKRLESFSFIAMVPGSAGNIIKQNHDGLENKELSTGISVCLPSSERISEFNEHITHDDRKSSSNDTVISAHTVPNQTNNVNIKNMSLCDSSSLSRFVPDKYDETYSETEIDVGSQIQSETELSDWAIDDVVSDNLLNFELEFRPNKAVSRKKCDNQIADYSLIEIFKVEEMEFMDTEVNIGMSSTPTKSKVARDLDSQFSKEIDTAIDGHKSCVSYNSELPILSSLQESSLNREKKQEINYIDQGIYIFGNKSDAIGELKPRTQYLSPETDSITSYEFEQQFLKTCANSVRQTTPKDKPKYNIIVDNNCEAPIKQEMSEQFNLTFLPDAVLTNNNDSKTTICSVDAVYEWENLQTQQAANVDLLQKKLKKIAEDREKQRELIHDLVMNRLQKKKHTNTEKKIQNEIGIHEHDADVELNHSQSCLKRNQQTTQKAKVGVNVLTTKNGVFAPQMCDRGNNVSRDKRYDLAYSLNRFNQRKSEEVLKDNDSNTMQKKLSNISKILTPSKSLDEIITTENLPQYFERKFNFRSDTNLVISRQN